MTVSLVFIKKLLPRSFKDKIRQFFFRSKLKRIKNIFESSIKEPEWLSMDDLEKLIKEFPVVEVQAYDSNSLRLRAKKRVKEMQKFLRSNIKDILEIGCYDGMVSAELKKMGMNSTGIDIRDWLAQEAQEAGVQHYVMDATRMNFPDDSFDFIFTYDSFEHFSAPDKVLTEAHRVLRKGGLMYISFGNCIFSSKALHINDIINIPYPQLLFKKEDLDQYLEKKGLRPIPYDFINHWENKQFKELWAKFNGKFETLVYEEIFNLNDLNIIERYPSCFASKTADFDDLVVNDFRIVFRKIK